MAPKKPAVATITLSWNARADLKKVLECVRAQSYAPEKVIVVDNGSTDGTREMIKSEFGFSEFHELGQNTGYAAGYNKAFRLVSGSIKYVVVLDQDIVFGKDYIKKIVDRFEKEPRSTVILMCDLEEPLIKSFGLAEGYIKAFHGSCFAYRNSLKRHMVYDEKFFAYNNEADLSASLIKKGFRILYYPGCKSTHKKDSTIMNPFRAYLMTRNALWHWWKNSTVIDAVLASAITLGLFYSKASRYRCLPAYFRAVFDAFLGLPYCIRNRSVNKEISFKDMDEIRKIAGVLKFTKTETFFKILGSALTRMKWGGLR